LASKKARLAGPFRCAREDSNLHGPFSPQGPQPCASTNSATGAERASIARASFFARPPIGPAISRSARGRRLQRGSLLVVRARGHLHRMGRFDCALASVHPRRYICEHTFVSIATPSDAGVENMDLTKRQQEIFDFIRKYSAKYGYPPTVRDIGKAVGLASSSTVHAHLANLEKIGLLRRDPSKPRAIELLDRAVDRAVESVRGIVGADGLPLLGSVAAGQPMLAEENIEEYVAVPELAGGREGEYLLRIRGDSMKDAGILEGDYVVVHPQQTARNGDVVVALLGEEATVKRFFREDGHVRLQPENDAMEPIRSKEVKLLGRVVGLLRSI
jgi:repressor LexA